MGVLARSGEPETVVLNTIQNKPSEVPTLIDSGASDHCFVDKASFINLELLHRPITRLAAGKESTFKVIGKGKAKIHTMINNTRESITFENALYTPELRSNLISVSKLGEKGTSVTFDNNGALVKLVDGNTVIKAK